MIFRTTGVFAAAVVAAGLGSASFSAPVAAADVVDGPRVAWNYSGWGKPRGSSVIYMMMSDYIKERTGGKFTMEIHWGTLSQPRENLDGLKLGAFQAATYCASYYPGKLESATGLDLPFLPIDSLAQLSKIADDYHAHPAVAGDFDKWGSMYFANSILPLYEIVGRGEPPKGTEGWKGARIRALGPQGEAMKLLGAVPTNVPAPEVYVSMDRGLVDMVGFAFYSHLSYRTFELGKWFTHGLKLGSINCGIMLNKNSYASLPDQYKKILTEYLPIGYAAQVVELNKEEEIRGPETFRERGLQEIKFTPEERKAIEDIAAKPVWDGWVKKLTEAGYPGQELLDTILASAEKHKGFHF